MPPTAKERVGSLKISFMEKMTFEQMAQFEGGKFWGNSELRCTPVTNGAGTTLYEWCCADYYMLWIKVDTNCGEKSEW